MDKNSKEYKKAYSEALKHYGNITSLYRSAYIVKKYKEYGGVFKGKSPSPKKGIKRWMEEKWVQVIPYLKQDKIVECGSSYQNKHGKPCRPLKRISEETPTTLPELLKKYNKKEILDVAYVKQKNPEKRLYWNTLKIS